MPNFLTYLWAIYILIYAIDIMSNLDLFNKSLKIINSYLNTIILQTSQNMYSKCFYHFNLKSNPFSISSIYFLVYYTLCRIYTPDDKASKLKNSSFLKKRSQCSWIYSYKIIVDCSYLWSRIIWLWSPSLISKTKSNGISFTSSKLNSICCSELSLQFTFDLGYFDSLHYPNIR